MVRGTDPQDSCVNEVVVARHFDAPRDLVYLLWTNPDYVARWWGVGGATSVVHQMDVRPGGQWRLDMIVSSGTKYPNGGEFLEVVENERLVYTDVPDPASPAWSGNPPGPSVCTVDFESSGEGTLVRVTVRFNSEADLQRMVATGFEGGLGQALDRLARLVDGTAERHTPPP